MMHLTRHITSPPPPPESLRSSFPPHQPARPSTNPPLQTSSPSLLQFVTVLLLVFSSLPLIYLAICVSLERAAPLFGSANDNEWGGQKEQI